MNKSKLNRTLIKLLIDILFVFTKIPSQNKTKINA